MKCPRCGGTLKIETKKTGVNYKGNPVYTKSAYCNNCKTKKELGKFTKKNHHIVPILCLILVAALLGSGLFFLIKHKPAKKETAVVTNEVKNNTNEDTIYKLKTGMTFKDVSSLIKTKGNSISKSTVDGKQIERYQWNVKDSKDTVILTFSDQVLVQISRSNIDSVADFNPDIVKQIKPGVSYEETQNIIGAAGQMISESMEGETISSIYSWKNKNCTLTVTYMNNMMVSSNLYK